MKRSFSLLFFLNVPESDVLLILFLQNAGYILNDFFLKRGMQPEVYMNFFKSNMKFLVFTRRIL